MPRTLLCAFLLLFSRGVPSAAAEGDLCGRWASEKGSPAAAFLCPRRSDGADAFCCGTCSAPYCCASGEARLDQRRCPRASPQKASTTGGPRTTQPSTEKSEPEWETLIAIVVMIAVGGVLFFALCYCKERGFYRRTPGVFTREQTWVAIHSAAHHRYPTPRLVDAPPSYFATNPLPPILEETEFDNLPAPPSPAVTFQRASAGNPEEVCIVGPAAHENIPGPAVETVLERASRVEQ